MSIVGIVAHRRETTNGWLAAAWRGLGIDARVLEPEAALETLGPGDVALFRIDVLETLDGVEPGLEAAAALRGLGVRILNPPPALVGAHDKLETARRLAAASVPHPKTCHVLAAGDRIDVGWPAVVKPRHGSWGRDVHLCRTEGELRSCLLALEERPWFRRHGAIVQELAGTARRDLRLIVAGGRVVGAAAREARQGEWRTNVSLGGRLRVAAPDDDARALALAAVEAHGGDLMGVDLVALDGDGWTVLELNGAVDFDERYSLAGASAYAAASVALDLPPASLGPLAVADLAYGAVGARIAHQ